MTGHRTARAIDAAIVVGLMVILTIAAGATLEQGRLPIAPTAAASIDRLPSSRTKTAPPIRDLPAFSADGPAAAAAHDPGFASDVTAQLESIHHMAGRIFGITDFADFDVLLSRRTELCLACRPTDVYPYQYPAVIAYIDAHLPAISASQVDELNDLAALLILASPPAETSEGPLVNAPPVAYELLRRAALSGDCTAQLNFAFVLSIDLQPMDDGVRNEFQRAATACPGDPSPLWYLGEFQIQRAQVSAVETLGEDLSVADRVGRPLLTFVALQDEMPGSPAGWSGEADYWLKVAGQKLEAGTQPFASRRQFTRALELYRAAYAIWPDAHLLVGEAHALAGLNRFGEAAALLRNRRVTDLDSEDITEWARQYAERDHDYAAAVMVGGNFDTGRLRGWSPTALIPISGTGDPQRALMLSGERGTYSLGAGRLRPTSLSVGPPTGGAGAGVEDLSFLPEYRTDFVAGGALATYQPGCHAWSMARDLLLAGRASDALLYIPDANVGHCDVDQLRDVVWRAVGRSSPADAMSPAELDDAMQNLYRFAGDYAAAARVAADWIKIQPAANEPYDRAAEIAFLRKDYATAAAYFRVAAQWCGVGEVATACTVTEQLKLGAVQILGGEPRAALVPLNQADRTMTEIIRGSPSDDEVVLAYHVSAQLGLAYMAIRNWPSAQAAYNTAYRLVGYVTGLSDLGLPHDEVIDNNLALVDIKLKSADTAAELARSALATDADSPLFLQTLAFADQAAGHPDQAIKLYREAVSADPTLFPAYNDLGVLLAQQVDKAAAETAFRHAIGANPAYALGWFNLGVLLRGMGPAHYLDAQAALGKAARLHSAYRQASLVMHFDLDPYFAQVDLSRPLPAGWTFSQHETRTPLTISALVVLLLLVRLGWQLGLDEVFGRATEWVLHRSHWLTAGRWRALVAPRTPLLAAAITCAVFVWPTLRPITVASVLDNVILAAGVLTCLGVYVRLRSRHVAALNSTVKHFTWPPSIVIGIAAAAAGQSFAPVPTAEHGGEVKSARWVGLAGLTAIAGVLTTIDWVVGLPMVRALSSAVLVMLGSVLLPIKPYDGAYITKKWVGIAILIIVLLWSCLMFFGVL